MQNLRMHSNRFCGARQENGQSATDHAKEMAQELVERFPQKFSVDFQSDKKSVDFLTNVKSKKLRNRIADYITRIMGIAYEKEELEDPSDIDWARHRSASLHISMVVKRHRDVRKAIE